MYLDTLTKWRREKQEKVWSDDLKKVFDSTMPLTKYQDDNSNECVLELEKEA